MNEMNHLGHNDDNAFIVNLYSEQKPSGEMIIGYQHPKGQPFCPISEGHFGNVSKLLFQSGSLWLASLLIGFMAIPFFEYVFIDLLKLDFSEWLKTIFPHRHHHHHTYPREVNFGSFPIYFLGAMLMVAPWVMAFAAFVTVIYSVLSFLNLYGLHGKNTYNRLNAPDRVALSKLSVKLSWNGRFFNQYGAIFAWHDFAGLDFVPADGELDSDKITITYKMPDGYSCFPFELSSFNSKEEAKLFMEMLNKNVKDEVKTPAFKAACEKIDPITEQAKIDKVETLLSRHWDHSVVDSTTNPIADSVADSISESISDSISDSIADSVANSTNDSAANSVPHSVGDSVPDSVIAPSNGSILHQSQIGSKAEVTAVLRSLTKAQSESGGSTVFIGEKVKEKVQK